MICWPNSARKAGLGALALDNKGVCRLSFDDTLIVDLEHDDGAGVLHIYATVGPIPAEGKEEVYASLLSANLFGAETGGATLAIDRPRGEIVLCRAVDPEHLDPTAFENTLQAFVNALEQQRESLNSADNTAPEVPGRPDAVFGDGPFSAGVILRWPMDDAR